MENKEQVQEEITEQKHHKFLIENTDFEMRSLDAVCVNESELKHPWWYNLKYSFVGLLFGIVFVKAEILRVCNHCLQCMTYACSGIGCWFAKITSVCF